MCYKNFAPLGLQYKMNTILHECRPAGALIQKMHCCSSLAIMPFRSRGAAFL